MTLSTARKAGAVLALAAAISLPAITAAPAQAKGGASPVVTSSGACVGGGVWTLKAKHDGASIIEVEYQIDTNRAGQFWHVAISDNNVRVYTANKWTVPPSGAFTVQLRVANRLGVLDTVRTHSVATGGHSCTGSLHL